MRLGAAEWKARSLGELPARLEGAREKGEKVVEKEKEKEKNASAIEKGLERKIAMEKGLEKEDSNEELNEEKRAEKENVVEKKEGVFNEEDLNEEKEKEVFNEEELNEEVFNEEVFDKEELNEEDFDKEDVNEQDFDKEDFNEETLNEEVALKERTVVKVVLNEADLDEMFVKGSGNGGQKVNKTSNCVILKHRPTGLWVKVIPHACAPRDRLWRLTTQLTTVFLPVHPLFGSSVVPLFGPYGSGPEKCHETRSLAQNRKAARRWLLKKLDELVNGDVSKAAVKADKERRRKSKQRQRARRKYGEPGDAGSG